MAEGGPSEGTDLDIELALNFTPDTGLQFQKSQIHISERGFDVFGAMSLSIPRDDLRYATTRKIKTSKTSEDLYVVSYCDTSSDNAVKNIFIRMILSPDSQPGLPLLHPLETLLQKKFLNKDLADPISNGEMESCLKVLQEQPKFIDFVDMNVSVNQETVVEQKGIGGTHNTYLFMLDDECITLYNDSLTDPKYRLMFWSDSTPDSIERINLERDSNSGFGNAITLYTKSHSFQFKSGVEVVELIESIKPKKKFVLKDEKFLNTPEMPGVLKSKEMDPSLLVQLMKGASINQPVQLSPRKPMQPYQSPTSSGFGEAASSEFGPPSIMVECEAAVRHLEGNEDIMAIWVTMEFDLQNMLGSGTVPYSDHRSGGLDPNSRPHLERALNDVIDQLRENNLDVALSRLQASRELFSGSEDRGIAEIFHESDMMLMKKFYMKSLC